MRAIYCAISMLMQHLVIYCAAVCQHNIVFPSTVALRQMRVPQSETYELPEVIMSFCKTEPVKKDAAARCSSSQKMQGWIGFLEGNDEELLKQIIEQILPCLPMEKPAIQEVDAKQLLAQVCDAKSKHFERRTAELAALKISLKFYDEYFDGIIIASQTFHEICAYYKIDIADKRDAQVQQELDELSSSFWRLPYLTIRPAKKYAQRRAGMRCN